MKFIIYCLVGGMQDQRAVVAEVNRFRIDR